MRISRQNLKKTYFHKFKFIFILASLTLTYSCSNKKSLLFYANNGQGVKSSINNANSASHDAYAPLIQPGDQLVITNLSNDALINGLGSSTPLQIQYQVDENGAVKLPIIEKVVLGGMTTKDAEAYITNAYKAKALANPIFVVAIANSKVTLLGEFSNQGNFKLENQNTSLIDVIGEADGFTTRADKTKLKIIRGDKKNPEVIDVDLTDINSLASAKLQLRNGDIIYSQPRSIYLFTDKFAPIISYVGIGTTLLNLIFLFSRR